METKEKLAHVVRMDLTNAHFKVSEPLPRAEAEAVLTKLKTYKPGPIHSWIVEEGGVLPHW